MLNWRDLGHPQAGGAELWTQRVLERLIDRGWSVEWFSAGYPGAKASEVRGGIRYVRAGSQVTVHAAAFRRYAFRDDFDVVIDQVNTIPFYSPLYFRCRKVAFFHQLAGEVWRLEMPPPIGIIGQVLEPWYLRPYVACEVMTVSNSTAKSLRDIGFRGNIHVIPTAVDEIGEESMPDKTCPPDIVVVGRLTRSKRVEHALYAAARLRASGWQGRLHIVGSGEDDYARTLKGLGAELLDGQVVFHGRVTMAERAHLLQVASVIWMTSAREGWGLVVTEAARHWTPAVAYDVPGLRDSVQDGVTGTLVQQSPAELAAATQRMLERGWAAYAERSRVASELLSWERTAQAVYDLLENRF